MASSKIHKETFPEDLHEEDLTNNYDNMIDDDYILEKLLQGESAEQIAAAIENSGRIDYDENFIQKKLMEGKTREDIADMLSHKSYKAIDMYMRRRGYCWDSDKQIYLLKVAENQEKSSMEDTPSTSKVRRILHLFESDIDPKEIAKRVGLNNHKAMAEYMKSKGYVWSSEKHTYVLQKGKIATEKNKPIDEKEDLQEIDFTNKEQPYNNENFSKLERLEKLIPMLEMIDRNKDKLTQILSINEHGTIPRYVIGGVTITKSLCMSHPLSELIKEFSKEKNISQREIFEVALIEFLKKYGYENEVKTLFL